MIRLSVIIPAWNAGPLLAEAVASITARERDDVEILVVDDGSTDGSADSVAAMPGVRLLRQSNSGPGAARNRGLAAASGEHIGFLDADDIWLHGRAEVLLAPGTAEAEALRRADFIYSDYVIRDLARATVRRHTCPPLAEPAAHSIALHNPICTSTVVARRAAIEAAGGFRTDVRFGEDWDLWLRLAEQGTVVQIRNMWAEHRERPGSLVGGDLAAIHRAGEAVLDAAFARSPALYRPVARAARARLECRSGVRAYRAGDYAGARRHLARAVGGGCLRPALKLYARTLWRPGGGPRRET